MDIKRIMQSFKTAFSCLLISAGLVLAPVATAEVELTPRWTERYLFKHNPELVLNTHLDQVLSFYYFGSFQNFTLMGMERVRGEDYHQYNTLLIFKGLVLQGYYEELAVFPASIEQQGVVKFPANNDVIENIDLGRGHYPSIIFSRDKELNPEAYAVSDLVSLIEKIKDKK